MRWSLECTQPIGQVNGEEIAVLPDTADHPDIERLFEIGLVGDVCDLMRRAHPTARVAPARASTILWSRLRHPGELQVLLDALSDFGLGPCEVHESAAGVHAVQVSMSDPADAVDAWPRYCEVRIGSRLGAAALHHLRWPHRMVQTTVVTVRASQTTLPAVVAQMSTVTDVDYVVALRALPPTPRQEQLLLDSLP